MDTKVPLNRLKFGQEDGDGINARVSGREDGIATLAANIFANRKEENPTGLIENLIIKDAGGGFFSVANGNRRLAALHQIDGPDSDMEIPCTLHHVDGDKAFEYSLTTAITAEQLHPVDQYEAFARLEERGKSVDDIASQYGMTKRQVQQALALGRLSPKIRDAWRKGEIKAEVAKAFTLTDDHKLQDKVFAELAKRGTIYESWVKEQLGATATSEEVAQLLDFIGAEAYRAAGGHVTEDLFGHSHIFFDETDVTLLKQMARRALDAECERLKADGWGWAEIGSDLPHGAQFWDRSQPKKPIYEGDEEERLKKRRARLAEIDAMDESDYEIETEQDRLAGEVDTILAAVSARSFDEKQKKKLGCIVNVSAGRLFVLYGVKRPAEAPPPADDGDAAPARATKPSAAAKPAEPPPEEDISQALIQRLQLQSAKAAGTALIQDEQLALSLLLAGIDCYSGAGIRVSAKLPGGPGKLLGGANGDLASGLALARKMKPSERIALLTQVVAGALDFQASSAEGQAAIVNAIDAKAFNAAARGAFDAKDYFNGVSKKLNLKAIEEALGADHARQQAGKSKAEIAAFAIENVPATGWLPVQLRAKGYDGPPVKRGHLKPATAQNAFTPDMPAIERAAKRLRRAGAGKKKPAKAKPSAKRAAASKKSAKKTGKKRNG